MRSLYILAILVALAPLAILATVAPVEAPDWQWLANILFQAVSDGDWWAVGAVMVIGLVYVARTYGKGLVPWLATDRGGATLALVTGILGGLATAVLAGAEIGWPLLIDGLKVGLLAAGGWTVVRRILGLGEAKEAEVATS